MLLPQLTPLEYDVLRILLEHGEQSGDVIRSYLKVRKPRHKPLFYMKLDDLRRKHLIKYSTTIFTIDSRIYRYVVFSVTEEGLEEYKRAKKLIIFKPALASSTIASYGFEPQTNSVSQLRSLLRLPNVFAIASIVLLVELIVISILNFNGLAQLLTFALSTFFATFLATVFLAVILLINRIISALAMVIFELISWVVTLLFVVALPLVPLAIIYYSTLSVSTALLIYLACLPLIFFIFILLLVEKAESPEQLIEFAQRFAVLESKEIFTLSLREVFILNAKSLDGTNLQATTRIKTAFQVVHLLFTSLIASINNTITQYIPRNVKLLEWWWHNPF